MSSASALECRQLSCGYPGRTVLRDISFTLRAGSVTALLGPNGSGKSTLLKTISKLLKPIAGEVLVAGHPVSAMGYRELAKRIAFVPQEEHVAYAFTARQVVTMGRLPISGAFFDTAQDRQEAESAMATADCLQLADRAVTELSGGEKQRVLIARALAQDAKVLLMDEPTSHLDVGHQVAIAAVVRDLARRGYVVLVAVHDLNLASGMADDAVLLGDGQIALQGSVGSVLKSPHTDTVYGVAFRRLEPDAEGRTYLFPEG